MCTVVLSFLLLTPPFVLLLLAGGSLGPRTATNTLQKKNETGVAPNATSYTGAIAACSKAGDGDKALEWLRVMSEQGIAPEVHIVRTAVKQQCSIAGPLTKKYAHDSVCA